MMNTAALRGMISLRRGYAAVILAAAAVLGGCATKKDLRLMQASMMEMRAQQDSVLHELGRQQRVLLDSIRSTMALTVDTRGTTSFKLTEQSNIIESLRQLGSQNMATLRQMGARMDSLEQKLQQAAAAAPAPGTSIPSAGGASATSLYQQGIAYMNDGSYGSARTVFQTLIRTYRDDPHAADAQFQIAESWVLDESYDNAYKSYEQVASDWPGSPRAGEALYRAGKVAEDRKDKPRARRYYQEVIDRFPDQKKLATAGLARVK